MRRAILVSLLLLALVGIDGCGGGSGGSIVGTSASPNAFSGQYAFSLAGFDSSGNSLGMSGSIKADGMGHITAGEVDVNDNGVVSTNSSLSGTYSFDASGNSTLGTVTLTTTVGTVAHPLGFGFSLQASGAFGQIMSLDTNNFVAGGTIQLQSSPVLTLSGMAGDYIVTVNGRNSTSPTSALGRFTLAANGATSNVTFDRSVAGVGTAGPTVGASATVTFPAAGTDANGRGTFSLTLNDGLVTTTTQNFAYYAISTARIVAVETDTTGTMVADFSRQSTPFTASTVVTTGSVFGISGIDTTASNEIAAVGQMQISAAPNTATLHWDSNDNGGVVTIPNLTGQAVVFDPTTGRGTVSVTSGTSNGLADAAVLYLTAPGTGFMMDITAGTTNRATAGPLTAQTTGPYSAATDLGGLGVVRSRGSSVSDALSLVGLFGLTTTAGDYALLFDDRFPLNGVVQTQLDTSSSGLAVLTLDPTVGRGTLSVPAGGGVATEAFYVIGPNQFVFIDISPISSGENGASSVYFVNPH